MATPAPSSRRLDSHTSTTLGEVLDSYAAGQEVPGSGSAVALAGALGAALVISVAKMTLKSDRPQYLPVKQLAEDAVRRCEKAREELQELADRDLHVFPPVIAIRREAKTLTDKYQQDQAVRREIGATKPATELPLRVAEILIEIGQFAAAMARQGFQPANGESYAALANSISTIESALYVARMNVLSIQKKVLALNDPELEREWLERMKRRIGELRSGTRPLRVAEISLRRRSQTMIRDVPKKPKRRRARRKKA